MGERGSIVIVAVFFLRAKSRSNSEEDGKKNPSNYKRPEYRISPLLGLTSSFPLEFKFGFKFG